MSAVLAADYDLIIRQGRLIDGLGTPATQGDVAIKDGRIAALGRVTGTAPKEIDARGLTVAPGFIDVHTHAENIDDFPQADNFLRMGVTTLVLGNCGGSSIQVGKFFDKLNDILISANVATLVGHGTIRNQVMGGSFMRPPTDKELADMKNLTGKAMREGAIGLSTGLIYLPGTFAATEEIIELAKVAQAHGGIYVSHMRNEAEEIFDALHELIRIAREARIPAHVSHIKLSGPSNWGQPDKVLALLQSARADGLRITQDMYAYPASSTGISQLIPAQAREGNRFKQRLADPAEKAKIIRQMKESLARRGSGDYVYAMIANYGHNPALNGLNVAQAARQTRGSDQLDAQIEMVLEIQSHGGAHGVFHSMSEDDLRVFMQHTNTMIAADSSVREFNNGVPHPRGYGNNARVLARYVRDMKHLSLEEAIRRMTSLPAQTFRLKDRGVLKEGAWADVVVFDPDKVQDHATFTEPHQYATGFRAVLVNGELTIDRDRHTESRAGQTLPHGVGK